MKQIHPSTFHHQNTHINLKTNRVHPFTSFVKHAFCFFCILILTITVTGCHTSTNTPSAHTVSFESFLHSLFLEEVQSDSISLNYTLAYPEQYGIKHFTPTLGHYSLASMQKGLMKTENCLATLKSYDYKSLNEEEQLIYDLLIDNLTPKDNMEDLFLYAECLGPTTGFQAQLPVLLAEYNFYQKSDIEAYLGLLPHVYDYFDEIITFQQEKSKAGLFMSDETADAIIEQCESFIKTPKENLLLEIFDNKLEKFPDLSKTKKEKYRSQNEDAVLHKVIPAYENVIKALTDLKGTGKNKGGLCNFPKGKEYYEYLVKSTTGSSRSIKKINKLLDSTFNTCILNMSRISMEDETIFEEFVGMTYPLTDPSEIITYLETAIETDFPPLDSVNCTIKYVHPSLEDYLSPAFYLTPALDNFSENSIYINGGKDYDLSGIFPTIAHEGYPGHLYQSVYFNQQSPAPIRSLLSYGGYSEGWATYVEAYSYSIAGFSEKLAEFCVNNLIGTLCMYAKADIGVNYLGWDLEDTTNYLKSCGVSDEDAFKKVHNSMIEEPSTYMKYTLGYLEFAQMREKAENTLGDKFVLKDFHTFILDMGPCSFDILNERMEAWLKKQNL